MHQKIIYIVFLSFLVYHCSPEQKAEVIATIGNNSISIEEFQLTYQFNPYLIQIKDPNMAKKLLLRTLVAQKIIAAEGYQEQIEKNPPIARLIEQYHREALIESLWEEKIAVQVHISENEVYAAYLQSKRIRFFQYILFPDYQNANTAYQQLEKGMSFAQIAAFNGISSDMIPSDSISFGSELFEMEKAVFQLKLNEISPPLKIGQYYFIIKLLKEKSDLFTSEADLSDNYHRLAKILRKRKQREYFNRFIKSRFDRPPYHLDQTVFKQMVQYIEGRVIFDRPSVKQNQDLSNERIYRDAIQNLGDYQNVPVIAFENGNKWTIEFLLNRLQVGPYPIEFTNRGKFRMSMIAATKMTLDDQILVDLALANGLDKSSTVTHQTIMWKDHIVYQSKLKDILKKAERSDNLPGEKSTVKYEKQIDTYLANVAAKYQIQIYTDILDTLTLSKTDMVVMKAHFPKRTLAPVIQPFLNLPKFDHLLTSQY